MKKVVPFTKTINFKTMIAEVTDIELKHSLSLKNLSDIEGNILVDGKYKMTDASQIEEEFHYKLPFMITLDSKYDTSNLEISIGDFYFEIINEEDLKINADIDLDGLVEKKEELIRNDEIKVPIELEESIEKVDFEEDPLEQLEKELKEDFSKEEITETALEKNNSENTNTNIGSIFSSLTSKEETFSTYHVYIVREADTIDSILDKYKVTREELANYNDLDDIKLGSKLIIPCSND